LAPREYDEGWEYLFDGSPLKKRLATLGLNISPWQLAHYDENPSIGRFEAEAFNPLTWKPRVPTAAFLRARGDDNFWAARRVMAFSDDLIRAIVKTARFSDVAAEKALSDTLIARRNKIGGTYLTSVNPLIDPVLDGAGSLSFVNAAVSAGFASSPAGGYTSNWAVFDNSTNETRALGTVATAQGERLQSPPGLPAADGTFIKVQVAAVRPSHPAWAAPIDVYFKRVSGGWKLVGLERN
jgi:hypothetical protein